jgi:hypothetical protein
LPCGWPEATMRSARLRLDACTRIKTSFGAGAGWGTSRTATPLSPTTAAFMTLPGYRGLLIRVSDEPGIGRELSPILNWVGSPDAWPSSARYNAAITSAVASSSTRHWLATTRPGKQPARVSPWMPSPRLCAPNPDSQADGTTSLALVRKSITSRKGQDTLKKRRVLRLAR